MKRYLTIFSLSILLGMSTGSKGQDIHFSQFMKMRYSIIRPSQGFLAATINSALITAASGEV